MDESGAREAPQPKPYLWIGLGLLTLVVLILVAAFVLNNQLRPHVGIAPVSGATRTPGAHRISGAGSTPTAQSATATAAPTSTPATATPTARPTPAPSTREAVILAYHHYWQVYSQALYTLTISHVSEVAAGSELRQIQAQVASLRRDNRAVRVRVTHHALIVSVKGEKATVYDEILNRSFTIDPVTKQPPQGSNQADLEKDIYFLQKAQGTWKVVKSLRQEK